MDEEEDKGFFILVLGVLAAIITMVCWWYVSGGLAGADQPIVSEDTHSAEEDHSDDEDVEEEEEAAAPAPTAVPPTPVPEPTEEPEEERAAPQPSTVFDVIAADANLSVTTTLLRQQSLDTVLAGSDTFTVFAPSDDAASNAAASDTLNALIENDPTTILSYHVVSGEFTADQLREMAASGSGQLVSVQGESLDLSLDGDQIIVNGNSIASNPQTADNGIVHTIDNVLVPPVAALNTLVGAEPILFDVGSATIREESFPTLDSFIEVLAASSVNVSIEGHTDSTGDPVLNQNLSQSRARSVLNYLVANGVDESRLEAVGFGADKPIADNDTEEGQAQNRRIEFTLAN